MTRVSTIKNARRARPHRSTAPTAVLLLLALMAGPTLAIQPALWVHTTESDFAEGETDNTVVTNLGDVKLSAHTHDLADLTEDASTIHDLQATADGSIYLAVGSEGALLRHHDGQTEKVLDLPGQQVFALDLTADGRLLVAVSGAQCRLAVLENNNLNTILELEGVRYVWDIIVDGTKVYLATGDEAKLLKIDLPAKANQANPTLTELLQAPQDNLLCLGRDRSGRLYAGSDRDGLIYRVSVNDKGQPEVFVVYDAGEPEIGSILVLDDGTVYAGTADAQQARPGRLDEAEAESGRPETETRPAGDQGEPGEVPGVQPKPAPIETPGAPSENTPPPEPEAQSSAATPTSLVTPAASLSLPLLAASHDPSRSLTTLADSSAPSPPQTQGSQPAADQFDRLRAVIRQRLEQARRSGRVKPLGSGSGFGKSSGSSSNASSGAVQPARTSEEGNAIYRINPDGFVAEVFRESVMILKIVQDPAAPGRLLVATGNEGQLYRVDPAAEETSILADLECQQVPAVTVRQDKTMLLGTANPAKLVQLGTGFADHGSFTSPVLDAQQISLWGKFNLTGSLVKGTSVAVQTRSGNVEDPDDLTWSPWSPKRMLAFDPQSSPLAPREATIDSPPARFFQYQLTLNGTAQASPVVDRVQVTYVMPNLKPAIASVKASYPEPSKEQSKPSTKLDIEWEASDPNNDSLVYTLEYQPAGSGKWLRLAEKLDKNSFEWDTLRAPDGRYVIRVTATDSPDNPGDMAASAVRLADPTLIDNTPPSIARLEREIKGDTVTITAQAQDALSPIRGVSYLLDSNEQWDPVVPDDLIYDSTQESFHINIHDLAQGPHVVTVRASDSRGNTRYEAILLEIK